MFDFYIKTHNLYKRYWRIKEENYFFTHQATSLWANELAHLEMVGSLVHQLTEGVTIEELEKAGLSAYYTDHGVGLEYIQIRI